MDDRAAVVTLADAGGIDDLRTGWRRRTGGDGGIAGRGAVAAALFPDRLQMGDPAHVALAPAGDAVAHPVLFGDDSAVKLMLIAFLFRQNRVAPVFEMGKATLDATGLPAVEPDRAA